MSIAIKGEAQPALDEVRDRYDDIKNPPDDNPHKSLDKPRPVKPEQRGEYRIMPISGKRYKVNSDGSFEKV